MQLLAELSPKDAVFALVTDSASRQTTAKSMSVSTGEALSPILDEVQTTTCCWASVQYQVTHGHSHHLVLQVAKKMYITAGTLAEEYTEGGVVTLAHDQIVFMLLLQAKVATADGNVVDLYRVISSV